MSGTKEVSLTYPGKSGSKTVGGLSITLKKEDYLQQRVQKKSKLKYKNPIYTSSITGNAQVTAYWVLHSAEKKIRRSRNLILLMQTEKTAKQYGLNTKNYADLSGYRFRKSAG